MAGGRHALFNISPHDAFHRNFNYSPDYVSAEIKCDMKAIFTGRTPCYDIFVKVNLFTGPPDPLYAPNTTKITPHQTHSSHKPNYIQ